MVSHADRVLARGRRRRLLSGVPEIREFAAERTAIDGLWLISMKEVTDERGTVREFYRESAFLDAGLPSLGPGRLRKLLEERHITIELTAAAREAIADAGYDPVYGARPLKRALQRMIQDPLATKLLRGEFKAGDHVVLDEGPDGNITFTKGTRALEGEVVVH